MRRHSGFTLIELLTVCAILAAIAYVAWGAYVGVDHRVEDELAHAELMRLGTALQRFHGDTGYWPGQGPFRPAGGSCDPAVGGLIDLPGNAVWFNSAANLHLLFERPSLCAAHPLAHLENWNAESRRGWNGPYLPLAVRHWVDIDANVDVPAFGMGPSFGPPPVTWRTLPRNTPGYEAARHELRVHARPFIFLLDPPRVVYWGPDGRYGGENIGDSANNIPAAPCLPNASDPDGVDDIVICL